MTDDPPPPPPVGSPKGLRVGPPDPAAGGAELPELVMGAARSLRHAWVRALEPHGLSPHQARALRAVTGVRRDERPDDRPDEDGDGCGDQEGLRVSDLAAALRIAPRSATEVADGLEERGLVVRAADPADRRAVVLRVTDAGRALSRQVEDVRARSGEALLERLDVADRDELVRLLRLLLADDAAGRAGPPR